MKNKIKILAYHNVLPDDGTSGIKDTVKLSTFKSHMETIKIGDWQVVPLIQIINALNNGLELPKKAVVITFDDGYKGVLSYAAPVLNKCKYPATIFLSTAYIGTEKIFPWLPRNPNVEYNQSYTALNWEELRVLQESHFTIGSHFHTHQFLPTLNSIEIEKEIKISKKIISDNLGCEINVFSFPYSFPFKHTLWPEFKEKIIDMLVLNGVVGSCTLERKNITCKTNPYFLPRIPLFKNDIKPLFAIKLETNPLHLNFAQNFHQKYLKYRGI